MQQEFIKDVIGRLEKLGGPYAISGSVASNVWGIPRLTHDVDILVVLTIEDVPTVTSLFAKPFYVSESAIVEAIHSHGMFNIIDPGEGLKADLWVSAADAFSQSMLRRRQCVELFPGQKAFLCSAEDVLLHKLLWNKITPSERQLADAAGIAAVQADKLDLLYLRDWAAQQSTTDFLEEILQGKYLKKT